MTKNPFEIRADVLQLAKEYMDQQVKMAIDFAEKMKTLGTIDTDEYLAAFKPYDFDELMSKSQEMYSFVTKKD